MPLQVASTGSRQTYGALRVRAESRHLGVRCIRKRVARLMREARLRGRCRGRTKRVAGEKKAERRSVAPDLVMRDFRPEAPDRLWVADMAYARSWEG